MTVERTAKRVKGTTRHTWGGLGAAECLARLACDAEALDLVYAGRLVVRRARALFKDSALGGDGSGHIVSETAVRDLRRAVARWDALVAAVVTREMAEEAAWAGSYTQRYRRTAGGKTVKR